MNSKVTLQPYNRVLSGFDKLTVLSMTIPECSVLAEKYKDMGITGYRMGDFSGNTFIHRYLPCSFYRVPMLIYKGEYLLPMVFRDSSESHLLFMEEHRFSSLLILLEWEIKNRPKKVIIETRDNKYSYANQNLLVIDTAYLAFRLTEIVDGASFPVSQMQSFDEFIEWNKVYRIVDHSFFGKHSMVFDIDNKLERKELEMVLKIIQNKYPEKKFFSLPKEVSKTSPKVTG